MKIPPKIKEYPYIHISEEFLGISKLMTPRVPLGFRDSRGQTIEDNKTKRVCFTSKGIVAAIKAIDPDGPFYIYGTKKLPGLRKLNLVKPSCARNNKYGKNFKALDWLIWFSRKNPNLFSKKEKALIKSLPLNYQLKSLYKKHLSPNIIGCVPDAAETGEVWATKPVKVKLIGYAVFDHSKLIIFAK